MSEVLAQALLAHREDRAQWSVFGDALQAEGDPRGALVSLMLEREQAPSRRLYDAEQAYRAAHPTLAPAGILVTAWWRGFPVAIRVRDEAGVRVAAADPALRFVEAATLEQSGVPRVVLPWRRVRMELDDEEPVAMAPILAALPQLELLLVEGRDVELDFTGARAPKLTVLALRDVGPTTGLDEAALPALREIHSLGETAADGLSDTEAWSRCARVLAADDWAMEPRPPVAYPDEVGAVEAVVDVELDEDVDLDLDNDDLDDDDVDALIDEPSSQLYQTIVATPRDGLTTAFVIAPHRIDPVLVRDVARGLGAFESLTAQVAAIDWQPVPMTAIRMRGWSTTQLMPYGLALALQQRLASPIALFAFSAGLGGDRWLVVGGDGPAIAGRVSEAELLRRVLDAGFGRDPGADALEHVLDALDGAPEYLIAGDGRGLDVLADIDPGSAVAPPEEDELGDGWGSHERDLATDQYMQEIEVPVELLLEVVPAPEEGDTEDGVPALADDDEPEPPETIDGADAWLRVDELGAELEADPDHEAVEVRWPDPEVVVNEQVDATGLPDLAACALCEQPGPLRRCSDCGALHCRRCLSGQAREDIVCATCLDEFEAAYRASKKADALE